MKAISYRNNKNIKYPLEKKSWIYQYQVLIDDILKKNEETRTRIQENEFNVLDDPVLANHITNYLKNNGYIRVIKGDMYPVYPGKNVPTKFNLQVVENKNNTNKLLWLILTNQEILRKKLKICF